MRNKRVSTWRLLTFPEMPQNARPDIKGKETDHAENGRHLRFTVIILSGMTFSASTIGSVCMRECNCVHMFAILVCLLLLLDGSHQFSSITSVFEWGKPGLSKCPTREVPEKQKPPPPNKKTKQQWQQQEKQNSTMTNNKAYYQQWQQEQKRTVKLLRTLCHGVSGRE